LGIVHDFFFHRLEINSEEITVGILDKSAAFTLKRVLIVCKCGHFIKDGWSINVDSQKIQDLKKSTQTNDR
jgi:invasion protein IalB